MTPHGLLTGRRALVHGGAGAIGRSIARVFVREGAKVAITGRSRARLAAAATELGAIALPCDVLDEAAVDANAAACVEALGGIDIMVNAIGVAHVQGVPLAELSLADMMLPVTTYVQSTFLTARAAGRVMAKQKRGVILALSVPGARLVGRGWLGHGVAFAAVDAMVRLLAAELGPSNVRVLGLRPDAIPETLHLGSHVREVFDRVAALAGTNAHDMIAMRGRTATLLGQLPALVDVAETAAFVASDRARSMTGTIVNLTCGSIAE